MYIDRVRDDYFEWMFDMVCRGRYAKENSYRKLLEYLHDAIFTPTMTQDVDRAGDGVNLRYRYALQKYEDNDCSYITECLDGPCSVLEMLIALSIRCEETIMDNPQNGNRTGQWFWKMIVSLGLGSEIDSRFDREYAEKVIGKFLNHEYDSDGHGGLFVIKNCDYNLRHIPIWTQMLWYLDTMI